MKKILLALAFGLCSIAAGASMLIFPGGGLMSLSWDGEFMQIAKFLNARGVAAIGVKYRTRVSSAMPRPAAPSQG